LLDACIFRASGLVKAIYAFLYDRKSIKVVERCVFKCQQGPIYVHASIWRELFKSLIVNTAGNKQFIGVMEFSCTIKCKSCSNTNQFIKTQTL